MILKDLLENRLANTEEEGKSGVNCEKTTDIHTLACVT